MGSANHYTVQGLYKDDLQHFTVEVPANDPVEAESIVRHQAPRELLIASVVRTPAAA